MALVSTITGLLATNFVIEDEDYIYLNGLAHDKTTLTPIFGRWTGINGMPANLNKAPRMRKYFTGEQGTSVDTMARDTTLVNPSNLGYVYSLVKQTQSNNYYNALGGAPNAYTGVGQTHYLYGRALGSNQMYDSVYSLASFIAVSTPVIVGSQTDGTFLLMLEGRYAATSAPTISKYPAAPGAGTAIISSTYGRLAQILYENSTYWFVASVTGQTNPTSVTIQAIAKSTMTPTQVYASTAQGTSYPSCSLSGVYAFSGTALYSYCTVSNAADPVYTIRYFNINPVTPTASAGSCTINWNGSSSAAEFSASTRTQPYPFLRTWITHTSTADYVCFALMELGGLNSETAANMKLYVFTINPSDPTQLTFKQTVAIGTAHGYIKNVFPLTDDYTKVGVVTSSNMHIYSFSDASGYQVGVAIPHSIFTTTTDVSALAGGIGVDELGRIWVQNAGNIGSSLHIYTSTTSSSITLTFAQSSYDYNGSVINSSFNLSAYNSAGARIATDVQVVLDSNNCTFSDDTTIKTITTSSSAETTVNVKITGPGQIRAVANIAI